MFVQRFMLLKNYYIGGKKLHGCNGITHFIISHRKEEKNCKFMLRMAVWAPLHGPLGLPVLSQILTDASLKYVKENYS